MPHLKLLLKHSAIQAATAPTDKNIAEKIFSISKLKTPTALKQFGVSAKTGLSLSEVRHRLYKYGKNEVAKEKKNPWWLILLKNLKDPLSLLLLALAIISFLTHDLRATIMIGAMIILSTTLRFFQEIKADKAAQKLQAMVRTTAKVIRQGQIKEIALSHLVPGDIVHLSAGDMIPADLLLISSKDLFVNQAALTGESLPAEKHAETTKLDQELLDLENICFLGTNVESGSAVGLIIETGAKTYLGGLAQNITAEKTLTSFDLGIKKFTWLIMKFILIMVPVVFLINGLARGNWFEAFLFALAVAVGLAPEMLPMIVTVNLSKGALDMSRKKVIVKHLNSIQNFGAMDTLCTDKTGTLTEGRVVLEKYLDVEGNEFPEVLRLAYLNSHFQTGLSNLLDGAILNHQELSKEMQISKTYKPIDEIPFDFARRRMSVVVEHLHDGQTLICKGAVEEILQLCSKVKIKGKIIDIKKLKKTIKAELKIKLNEEGFRVMAVAYKNIEETKSRYTTADESGLILVGFLAFLDPPKDTAKIAIEKMRQYGIKIKVLTGDNDLVTGKVCAEVGITANKIVLGSEIEKLSETELIKIVRQADVFAKLTPAHKEKIVSALRQSGAVVGFMGDGINDAPALRAADVGISVDSAADIAKESSDIILLEKNLLVLQDGLIDGRKIFGNIVKYLQMAASSNFGNMFSVVGGSLFLPFLPMLPLQILTNNLLYDISQTSIPTDKVDADYLLKPRQWDISRIKKFILFIGPLSSLFDYATYFAMLFIFNAWFNPALFHTGWFVESLISQTLIIYIIRTEKIPFLQSRPSWPLTLTTLFICALGIYLPFSPLASALGFVALPPLYWFILFIFIITYFVLTQLVKKWFNKKYQLE